MSGPILPTSNEPTVSCLCGTVGCNAESCNPVTYKLAVASRENRSLRAEIERLRGDLQKATTGLGAVIEAERRSAPETSTRRSVEGLFLDGHEVGQQFPVQPVLGTDRAVSDDRLRWLIRQENESAAHRAFVELWERRGSPVGISAIRPGSRREGHEAEVGCSQETSTKRQAGVVCVIHGTFPDFTLCPECPQKASEKP